MLDGDALLDWETVALSLIHPTKVIILKAMLWIERPISATELEKIAGGAPAVSAFSFHLKQLAKAEVLEVVGKLKIRRCQSNKKETFFYLVGKSDWMLPLLRDADDPLTKLAGMLIVQHPRPIIGAAG